MEIKKYNLSILVGLSTITFALFSGSVWACSQANHTRECRELGHKVKVLHSKTDKSIREESELQEQASLLLELRNRGERDLISQAKDHFKQKRDALRASFLSEETQIRAYLDVLDQRKKEKEHELASKTELLQKFERLACWYDDMVDFFGKESESKAKKKEGMIREINAIRDAIEIAEKEIEENDRVLFSKKLTYLDRFMDLQSQEDQSLSYHEACIKKNDHHIHQIIDASRIRESQMNRKLGSLGERLSRVEEVVQNHEYQLSDIFKYSAIQWTKQIELFQQAHPKASLYLDEFNKYFYTTLLVYWSLSSGKIATETTRTELSARFVGTGIRVIPGSEPIASAVEFVIIALKSHEREKRFKNAYQSFRNPRVLENVSEILALKLAQEYRVQLEEMDEAKILKKAQESAKAAYHSVTAGELLSHGPFRVKAPSPEEIADFLVEKVHVIYEVYGFPQKEKKWSRMIRSYSASNGLIKGPEKLRALVKSSSSL